MSAFSAVAITLVGALVMPTCQAVATIDAAVPVDEDDLLMFASADNEDGVIASADKVSTALSRGLKLPLRAGANQESVAEAEELVSQKQEALREAEDRFFVREKRRELREAEQNAALLQEQEQAVRNAVQEQIRLDQQSAKQRQKKMKDVFTQAVKMVQSKAYSDTAALVELRHELKSVLNASKSLEKHQAKTQEQLTEMQMSQNRQAQRNYELQVAIDHAILVTKDRQRVLSAIEQEGKLAAKAKDVKNELLQVAGGADQQLASVVENLHSSEQAIDYHGQALQELAKNIFASDQVQRDARSFANDEQPTRSSARRKISLKYS